MDVFSAVAASRAEFDGRLRLVTREDWGRPTPCTEWRVRDLVNHVVGGCRRYTLLVHGATASEVAGLHSMNHLGTDPGIDFIQASDELDLALREQGVLDRTVDHPAGKRSAEDLAGLRALENTVHAWDLARALGTPDRVDAGLAGWCLDYVRAHEQQLADSRFFDAPLPDEGERDPQHLLLLATGRTP